MKNILVAIDFEEKAQLLIDMAEKFAEKFDAKIWLVHISAPEPNYIGYDVGPVYIKDLHENELKREHKLLDDLAGGVKQRGYDSEGLLISDTSVKYILKEAQKLNADMIIVGSHRHGFLYNLWFGNTPDILIHKSKFPILVVPLD